MGEGIEFFTCNQYSLCKECTNGYKPCHERQEEMRQEYINNIKKEQEIEAIQSQQSYSEFIEEVNYWNGF